jgi:hypothetical protein
MSEHVEEGRLRGREDRNREQLQEVNGEERNKDEWNIVARFGVSSVRSKRGIMNIEAGEKLQGMYD